MIIIQNTAVESVLFSCVFCNAFIWWAGERGSRKIQGSLRYNFHRLVSATAASSLHGNAHGSYWVVKMATMVLLGTETG